MTKRGRVTAATVMEAAMKASDGDEGDGEGNSGGGQATVSKGRWRGRQEQRWQRRRGWRVKKRTRASNRAANHFILNWNKMFDLPHKMPKLIHNN